MDKFNIGDVTNCRIIEGYQLITYPTTPGEDPMEEYYSYMYKENSYFIIFADRSRGFHPKDYIDMNNNLVTNIFKPI